VSGASPDAAATLNPILNRPYDVPEWHWEIGRAGGPTGNRLPGRRPSESFIPIAPVRKGRSRAGAGTDAGEQAELSFDLTGERREANTLVNDLRRDVDRWRHRGYERVTPISRKLLQHWADPERENRVLFCQREAAETAIFLAEVAGRHGYADWRRRVDQANAEHNAGLPRVALKMATGSGKTVVMAMLIAWQTANKVANPRDARFAKRFLVVTPGITIRDRLRVLQPADSGNYYDERDLVPPDLKGWIRQAQIVITNYHTFLQRDAKEIKGVSANTRRLLLAGAASDPFKETADAMVSRVLRDFAGSTEQIVVFNDEAHHCYQDRPVTAVEGHARPSKLSREEQEANDDARVWFKGLQAIHRRIGIKTVIDLSATPFYLGGSGYNEGYIFPWVVSDFSLMDAIESGIVKVPRTPVTDDAVGDLVTYLRLWDHVGDKLPKRSAPPPTAAGWVPPPELEGALQSLYRDYRASFERWAAAPPSQRGTPPVFIVVCPNTVVSRLAYEYIAGSVIGGEDGHQRVAPGQLELLSNAVDGRVLDRPRTILVDSAQLESGDAMRPDFKAAASVEIDAFKAEYRRRNPGADVNKITDEDLLREVMNTVGKPGRLGEDVRCVVSVAMLTEGWDANTVTHILGIRAFRSQLLCEQVVGRGLRRRSYAVNDAGYFDAEYANVYGIPFAFIPSDRATPEPPPRPPALLVEAVPGREHLRIEFPRLEGYRLEIPDADIVFDVTAAEPFVIGPNTVPTTTTVAGIVGDAAEMDDRDEREYRVQEVAFALARRLVNSHFAVGEDRRPWLFPRLLRICEQWLRTYVRTEPGFSIGHIVRFAEHQAVAADKVYSAITELDDRQVRLRPILRSVDPVGSTADVSFVTRKPAIETVRSEVSHTVLDGARSGSGNTWEQIIALECELPSSRVAAYVKNDHLGFTIPYIHQGRTHSYLPDFLLRLEQRPGDVVRTLIVEVSGGRKSPGPTAVKASTARDSWCAAVNNHGGFGHWGYLEVTSMNGVHDVLSSAIDALYDDAPIIGDPDTLDFGRFDRGRAGGSAGSLSSGGAHAAS
jgi:type III restriction enzyme